VGGGHRCKVLIYLRQEEEEDIQSLWFSFLEHSCEYK
jgi:hypothetical protein